MKSKVNLLFNHSLKFFKAYLETEDNEDNPNLRVIALTKSKDLEETYAEKKKAFDAVAAIWSGFEMECNALLEDLRPENISHEVVVDAADRLKALKFKVNSVSPKTEQVLA